MKSSGIIVLLMVIMAGMTGCSSNSSSAFAETEQISNMQDKTMDTFTEIPTNKSADTDTDNENGSEKINETDMGNATPSQKQALKKASSYLSLSAFSHSGLIKQLQYNDFSEEDATYAADNCGADWKEQALKKSENYMSLSSFSKDGLIKQLKYDGFSDEEASYAAEIVFEGSGDGSENEDSGVGVSAENALEKAKTYLALSAFSYSGLIKQLNYDGFSEEDATYAADNCGADWNEQAAKKAESYLELTSFSGEGLVKQLEYDGFSHEQAVYGATQNGL